MTNEEKIKSLSGDELASFIHDARTKYCQYTCIAEDGYMHFTGQDCINCISEWLQADTDLPYKKNKCESKNAKKMEN